MKAPFAEKELKPLLLEPIKEAEEWINILKGRME